MSTKNRERRIKKCVRKLRNLEDNCLKTRGRYWADRFLSRLYKFYANWKKNRVGAARRQDLIRYVLRVPSVRSDKTSPTCHVRLHEPGQSKNAKSMDARFVNGRCQRHTARGIAELSARQQGRNRGRCRRVRRPQKDTERKKGPRQDGWVRNQGFA